MKDAELEAESIYRPWTEINAAKEVKDTLENAWFKPRRGGWRIREAKDNTLKVGEGQRIQRSWRHIRVCVRVRVIIRKTNKDLRAGEGWIIRSRK